MAHARIIRKIGSLRLIAGGWMVLSALLGARGGLAQTVQFTASVDRPEISMEESVSLKLTIRTEGNLRADNVSFKAPEFDLINQYDNVFVESFYENGNFGVRNNYQMTRVLKPSKPGTFTISGIKVQVGGQPYTAADLRVTVTPAGQSTQPPRGYGGSGVGLRGAGKRVSGVPAIIRAEVDKDRVYKGEQLIVTYYLYTRVNIIDKDAAKLPNLNGFLKEELDMRIFLRSPGERVVLDGVPYVRVPLLSYAAFPIQEGKLKIDPLALKIKYYAQSGTDQEDDQIFQFFQQMQVRTTDVRSEAVPIQVLPLPEEGKPAGFTGAVGDFTISSAVNRYEIPANEALTLTVKVEGRGNLAAIGEPKAAWPSSVEIYDATSRTKSGKGGVGEKLFEFILIPREPGKLTLPAIELSAFDPVSRQYVTKKAEPVDITVGPPSAGGATLPRQRAGDPSNAASPTKSGQALQELRGLVPPARPEQQIRGFPFWRLLYWLCGITFAFFVGLVVYDRVRGMRTELKKREQSDALARSKSWEQLRKSAEAAANGASWKDVTEAYERLTGAVFDAIDRKYSVGARSLSRSDLKRLLVGEKGLQQDSWARAERVLEYAEMVRFASSAGAVSESAARQDLRKWVLEAKGFVEALPAEQELS